MQIRPGRCHPTAVLRDEHRLILRVVDALEVFLDRGAGPGAADDLGDAVTFFRLFTVACHHGKEEDLLFDAMVHEGHSREGGAIGVMLEEHRQGRELVGRMAEGVARLRAEGAGDGAERAWADVESAGRDYAYLLRGHIAREDGGVFDMADGTLDEPACRRLCDAYDEVCSRRFEGRSVDQLEALAARLTERAGGSGGGPAAEA